MKTSMWLSLILLGGSLAGCSAQQQQSTTHEVEQDVRNLSKVDGALDVRVSAGIAAQAGVNTFHVAPAAHNGVITLTGTAPSHEVDRVIVQTVRGVSGVKGVVDHITIHS